MAGIWITDLRGFSFSEQLGRRDIGTGSVLGGLGWRLFFFFFVFFVDEACATPSSPNGAAVRQAVLRTRRDSLYNTGCFVPWDRLSSKKGELMDIMDLCLLTRHAPLLPRVSVASFYLVSQNPRRVIAEVTPAL